MAELIRQSLTTISNDTIMFIPNCRSNNCYVMFNIFDNIINIYVVGGNMMLLHLYHCQIFYCDDHFHSCVVKDKIYQPSKHYAV